MTSSSELKQEPLAARMRPRHISDFIGQEHILAPGRPLNEAITRGLPHSMILWGPPGVGKTTLARIMAETSDGHFESISAVLSGVREIRGAVERAEQRREINGRSTILFVDEVHRFNKSQQDAFLPHIENGTLIFIGATTENPSFELNNALLSRARVYVLKSLGDEALVRVLEAALSDPERGLGEEGLQIANDGLARLAAAADGDARQALNLLEIAASLAEAHILDIDRAKHQEKVEANGGAKGGANEEASEKLAGQAKRAESAPRTVTAEIIAQVLQGSSRRFDKGGDSFYEQISALHKAVRGSSPDAALYWAMRMLDGGCDPLYIARRLVRMASEDIGNADPRCLQIALNAWDAHARLGSPEGDLMIAQAVIYLACAPKSDAVYRAFNEVREDVRRSGSLEVPPHLRNAATGLMKKLGYGAEYRYAHHEEGGYAAGENYFPPELKDARYYCPVNRGLEVKIGEKLERLREHDRNSPDQRYDDSD